MIVSVVWNETSARPSISGTLGREPTASTIRSLRSCRPPRRRSPGRSRSSPQDTSSPATCDWLPRLAAGYRDLVLHQTSARQRETRMGVIRKTLSVGTLGLVSFRSKKERLRRAERSQRDAEAFLEAEHAARVAAEARIAAAEKRVKRASAEAAQASKRVEQSKRSRRH